MKQTARIIRNNVPYTLLSNGVQYGEVINVPSVAAARLLPDPPPAAIIVGSNGVTVSGTYYWDGVSVLADDGQSVIKVTAITYGRYIAASVVASGGSGGLSVENVAALKAILSTSLTDTQPATIQTPGSNWTWSASSGAGFESDDVTVIRPNNVLLASNGRWYNTAPSPIVATFDAARLAVAGKHQTIEIYARSTANDGGGGTFAYDSTDTTSTDNDGTVLVAGTRRYKRQYSGPLDIRWFGGLAGGVSSNDDALASAIAALDPSGFFVFDRGGKILFPKGVWNFDETIHLHHSVELCGEGSNHFYVDGASILTFPVGSSGIVVDYLDDDDGVGAQGAYIHDLILCSGPWNAAQPGSAPWSKWLPSTPYDAGDYVIPPEWTSLGYALVCTQAGTSDTTPPAAWHDWAQTYGSQDPGTTHSDGTVVWTPVVSAHGVWVQSNSVTIERVYVRHFLNNGFCVLGDTGAVPASNSNLCKLYDCFAHANGGHGLLMAGVDSNACNVIGFNGTANGNFAVHDRSFLGNVHIGHHADANTGGTPYKINGATYKLYAEASQGASYLQGSVFDGTHGDGFTNARRRVWTNGASILFREYRKPTVENGYYYRCETDPGGTTDASEPDWPLGKGTTVVDNDITWSCFGIVPPDDVQGPRIMPDEVANLHVKNLGNTDDVGLILGGPKLTSAGARDNAIFKVQYTRPAAPEGDSVGEDIISLQFSVSNKMWSWTNQYDIDMFAMYHQTNPGTHNYRLGYFPYGAGIGVYGEDPSAGVYTYVALSAAPTGPGAGVAHKLGAIILNSEPSAGEWFAKRCITAGTPGTFEEIGAPLVATSTTRVVRATPQFVTTEYSIDRDFQLTTLAATTVISVWPLEIPHGATLNSVVVKVVGAAGHGALPGTMPQVRWRKWNISAGSGSVSSAAVDASGSTVTFEGPHSITKSSINEVIDNSTTRYGVQFESEDGANALAGLIVMGVTAVFTTTTAADLGAA